MKTTLVGMGLLVVWASLSDAQVLSDIYDFGGIPDDGQSPVGLVLGTNGNFYGVTRNGGTNGDGSLFQLTVAGVETPLYSFKDGNDGSSPGAGLTQGTNGLFYGVAEVGGSNGFGSIFSITTNGAFTALHAFVLPRSTKTGLITNSDGYTPSAALILSTNGNFYGSAAQGGTNGYGTLFQMTHQAKVTVLYSFSNNVDGGAPKASLFQFTNGYFYGTTTTGGSNGLGTLFQLSPVGKLTALYSFTGGDDGGIPEAALSSGHDGSLYGTCTTGGNSDSGSGTIFKTTTNGAVTPLYSFTDTSPDAPYYNNDGADPRTIVLGPDGSLYGAAYDGGTNGAGGIFKFSVAAGLTPLYSFNYLNYNGATYADADGGEPMTLLLNSDGNFYGVGFAGGTNAGGVAFRVGFPPQITVEPSNELVSLHSNASFSVTATGALAYQWQLDGTNISSATNSALNLTNVLVAGAGYYQAILTNLNGAVTSSVVTLGITNVPASFVAGGGALSYAGGQVTLKLTNLVGQDEVIIDASPDLVHWTPIWTNLPSFSQFTLIDTNAAAFTNRFYRARSQ
jgi:uncharacterized repeat protein (TIGR03803 family)